MIWSSRARNRSPDFVVACFFGRIVPSDAAKESCFAAKGNPKMKSQGSGASTPKTLQSQTRHSAEHRFSINGSAIVHGRLVDFKELAVLVPSYAGALAVTY